MVTYSEHTLGTPVRPLQVRLYEAQPPRGGVIWVGGVGGGFDSPARDLYPELAEELTAHDLLSLRVRYRSATDLAQCILDVREAIAWLGERTEGPLGLIGHSLGGAVVIRAALLEPRVRTVVCLAPQSYGTDGVEKLAPKSLLLIHGDRDEILPDTCSRSIYARAAMPKTLQIVPGAGHVLDEDADGVKRTVRSWLVRELVQNA